MLSRLFKLPNHKKFEYRPRHFDEAKEELNQRVERIKQEVNREKTGKSSSFSSSEQLRSRMKQRWNRNSHSSSVKTSNMRVILIIAAIVLILWWIFK
jgi:hypothetical protein